MDPQANLAQQQWLLGQLKICKGNNRRRNLETDLTELRQALYDWIRDGGFEPDWTRAPEAATYFGHSTSKHSGEQTIMAKKNRKQTEEILRTGEVEKKSELHAENALLPGENQGESVLSDPSFIEQKEIRNVPTITVKFKGTQKNGIHTYSDESRGASVYFNKSLFAGAPPAELTFEAPEGVFAEPGTGRAPKGVSPEKAAKAAEKLAKDKERAEKTAARIKKQEEQLAKLKAALGEPAAAEASA